MADYSPAPDQEVEILSQYHEGLDGGGGGGGGGGGLSTSQIIALITLVPAGGTLLLLSGLVFAATAVGLAVAALPFLIFSPILVPAAAVLGLAATGFVTSQTLGATGVSALTWAWDYLRRALASWPATDGVGWRGKGDAGKDSPVVHIVQLET